MTADALISADDRSTASRSMKVLAANLLRSASVLTEVQHVEPLQGGRNNRVFRVRSSGRSFLLKQYFRHTADPRDRLGAEWRFSRLLWDGGVRDVPQPMAKDEAAGAALFEWIDGRPLRVEEVAPCRVDEAAQFVVAIQTLRSEGQQEGQSEGLRKGRVEQPIRAIQTASEACFSFDDHVALVQRRIERLMSIEATCDLHDSVQRWANDELLPRWDELLRQLAAELRTHRIDPAASLPADHRCLSPSDFGFHNALLRCDAQGADRLAFFDFEYAGWDDPAKLVCDFFCQPRLPAPLDAFDRFVEQVTQAVRCEAATRDVIASESRRMRMLLPVYPFKWCCICLNEFLPAGHARRTHASEQLASTDHLQSQFDSAKKILERIDHKPS